MTGFDRLDSKKLAELRKEGLRALDIAERLGWSERTVERARQRCGIKQSQLG